MIKSWNLFFVCLLAWMTGCDVPVTNIRPVGTAAAATANRSAHEDLDAALWMQTSAEYAAIAEMVYDSAGQHVERVLRQSSWSALPSQRDPGSANGKPRPAAVILDVDETVLDNSAFQVQLIQQGGEYNKTSWLAFCDQSESTAIPGAKRFIDRCRAADVSVYFVTNRDATSKSSTCRNLTALELLPEGDEQHVLCKGEQPDWTSDKESRRRFITETHRILALLGDDLNDFVFVGTKPTASERLQLSVEHNQMWGHGWFMLPNANYGGWERALYEWNDGLPRSEKLRHKRKNLRGPISNVPVRGADTKASTN